MGFIILLTMDFLHLSDLHLGKRMNGYSLIDDQRYFLFDVVLEECKKRKTPLILIAGDIYDVASPSAEAMDLFSDFLDSVSSLGIQIILIPGNHDSAERLRYVSSFLKRVGIHVVSTLEEARTPIEIGDACFYAIPFSRAFDFREVLGESCPETLAERYKAFLSLLPIAEDKANVLLLHAAVSSSDSVLLSGSETTYVGTSQILPSSLFGAFDYVALGHIHKSYPPSPNSFYAGSPLKYHIDEANEKKSLSFVHVEKGMFHIESVPFSPLRDLVLEEGMFEDLMHRRNDKDFVAVNLLDGVLVKNARERLQKTAFPHLVSLHNELPREKGAIPQAEARKSLSLHEDFASFYQMVQGRPLSPLMDRIVLEAEAASEKEKNA